MIKGGFGLYMFERCVYICGLFVASTVINHTRVLIYTISPRMETRLGNDFTSYLHSLCTCKLVFPVQDLFIATNYVFIPNPSVSLSPIDPSDQFAEPWKPSSPTYHLSQNIIWRLCVQIVVPLKLIIGHLYLIYLCNVLWGSC